HRDVRATGLGRRQILGRDGLVVGQIAANDEDQVRAYPVGQRQRWRSESKGLLETTGRSSVAQARARIHVWAARKASQLLRDVVGLVGQAAASQEHADVVGSCTTQPACA